MKCPNCQGTLIHHSQAHTSVECATCWSRYEIEWLVRFYHTLAACRRALTTVERVCNLDAFEEDDELWSDGERQALAAIKGARTAMRRAEKGDEQ